MVDAFKRLGGFVVLIHSVLFLLPARSFARNQVMEAVHIVPATKVEKGSGVWIDGQYVGYVTELKGHNKAMVLPGPHNIVVRRSGYIDLIEKVTVQPGSAVEIYVSMKRDPLVQFSKVTAEIKLDVTPSQAGVFPDGAFAGSAREFGGLGGPGRESLPGAPSRTADSSSGG